MNRLIAIDCCRSTWTSLCDPENTLAALGAACVWRCALQMRPVLKTGSSKSGPDPFHFAFLLSTPKSIYGSPARPKAKQHRSAVPAHAQNLTVFRSQVIRGSRSFDEHRWRHRGLIWQQAWHSPFFLRHLHTRTKRDQMQYVVGERTYATIYRPPMFGSLGQFCRSRTRRNIKSETSDRLVTIATNRVQRSYAQSIIFSQICGQ